MNYVFAVFYDFFLRFYNWFLLDSSFGETPFAHELAPGHQYCAMCCAYLNNLGCANSGVIVCICRESLYKYLRAQPLVGVRCRNFSFYSNPASSGRMYYSRIVWRIYIYGYTYWRDTRSLHNSPSKPIKAAQSPLGVQIPTCVLGQLGAIWMARGGDT